MGWAFFRRSSDIALCIGALEGGREATGGHLSVACTTSLYGVCLAWDGDQAAVLLLSRDFRIPDVALVADDVLGIVAVLGEPTSEPPSHDGRVRSVLVDAFRHSFDDQVRPFALPRATATIELRRFGAGASIAVASFHLSKDQAGAFSAPIVVSDKTEGHPPTSTSSIATETEVELSTLRPGRAHIRPTRNTLYAWSAPQEPRSTPAAFNVGPIKQVFPLVTTALAVRPRPFDAPTAGRLSFPRPVSADQQPATTLRSLEAMGSDVAVEITWIKEERGRNPFDDLVAIHRMRQREIYHHAYVRPGVARESFVNWGDVKDVELRKAVEEACRLFGIGNISNTYNVVSIKKLHRDYLRRLNNMPADGYIAEEIFMYNEYFDAKLGGNVFSVVFRGAVQGDDILFHSPNGEPLDTPNDDVGPPGTTHDGTTVAYRVGGGRLIRIKHYATLGIFESAARDAVMEYVGGERVATSRPSSPSLEWMARVAGDTVFSSGGITPLIAAAIDRDPMLGGVAHTERWAPHERSRAYFRDPAVARLVPFLGQPSGSYKPETSLKDEGALAQGFLRRAVKQAGVESLIEIPDTVEDQAAAFARLTAAPSSVGRLLQSGIRISPGRHDPEKVEQGLATLRQARSDHRLLLHDSHLGHRLEDMLHEILDGPSAAGAVSDETVLEAVELVRAYQAEIRAADEGLFGSEGIARPRNRRVRAEVADPRKDLSTFLDELEGSGKPERVREAQTWRSRLTEDLLPTAADKLLAVLREQFPDTEIIARIDALFQELARWANLRADLVANLADIGLRERNTIQFDGDLARRRVALDDWIIAQRGEVRAGSVPREVEERLAGLHSFADAALLHKAFRAMSRAWAVAANPRPPDEVRRRISLWPHEATETWRIFSDWENAAGLTAKFSDDLLPPGQLKSLASGRPTSQIR